VVESLKEAGDELFALLRFPRSQWKALRTTNALERINEEFRRRSLVCSGAGRLSASP
jgi:transposase-like protein